MRNADGSGQPETLKGTLDYGLSCSVYALTAKHS
jgi:hypothetical protein